MRAWDGVLIVVADLVVAVIAISVVALALVLILVVVWALVDVFEIFQFRGAWAELVVGVLRRSEGDAEEEGGNMHVEVVVLVFLDHVVVFNFFFSVLRYI